MNVHMLYTIIVSTGVWANVGIAVPARAVVLIQMNLVVQDEDESQSEKSL